MPRPTPRERFIKLTKDEQLECRRALVSFARLYAFLSQVVPFGDPALEKLYLYTKALARRLPRVERGALDLGDDVVLTHLRTELKETRNLTLLVGDPELEGFTGGARGKQNEPQKAKLSEIIQVLNDRFGTEFKSDDELYFNQIREALVLDEDLAAQAQANTLENFRFGFERSFETKVIERRDANEEIFNKLMDDPEFLATVTGAGFGPELRRHVSPLDAWKARRFAQPV